MRNQTSNQSNTPAETLLRADQLRYEKVFVRRVRSERHFAA